MSANARRKQRICVVTAGHVSCCPRMLKAADAFIDAGHDVRLVSVRHTDWAWAADQEVYSTRAWRWSVVNYDRAAGRRAFLWSGARFRGANVVARHVGATRMPVALAARAYGRVFPELLRCATAERADLYYGGSTGALAVTAAAARAAGVPYALDLEDFHSGEREDSPEGRLQNALAERIERAVLPGAAFLTTASDAIADAYLAKYGLRPTTINNTFPLPESVPCSEASGSGLRLYWFSQTIGSGRGLEDVVRAMGRAALHGELHLRGRPDPGYMEALTALAGSEAPRLRVVQLPPAPPDRMVELARGYDVGLAVEQPLVMNRALCLTNKAFTYVLAGLAVVFTDTPGQRRLAADLAGAVCYTPGDIDALAAGLYRWACEPQLLRQAKLAAWDAAVRRWHWDHSLERGQLVRAVNSVLS